MAIRSSRRWSVVAAVTSSFKEGTLYPALHRLEEARLVEGRWEEANIGTPRRYYHITAKGERVLSERTSEWNKFATAVNAIMVPQLNSNTLNSNTSTR